MEKLLELAKARFEHAEVCSRASSSDGVGVQNGELKRAGADARQGYSLRVIRDGKLGMASAMDLSEREDLLAQAEASLRASVEAPERFASGFSISLPSMEEETRRAERIFEPSLWHLADKVMKLRDELLPRLPGASLSISFGRERTWRSILTSSGAHLEWVSASIYASVSGGYPLGGAMSRAWSWPEMSDVPRGDLEDLVRWYRAGEREVRIPKGRMPVLFPAKVLGSLLWRLKTAANAKALFDGVSPLIGKEGEKLLSPNFTLENDPAAAHWEHRRRFCDDEGMPVRRLSLFEKGVFRGFYNDLTFARKTARPPTGTGSRGIFGAASAEVEHLVVAPGEATRSELLSACERLVVPQAFLGSHSGNLMNGDFSVGLAPGYLVEKGEVVGRLPDSMLAGNVYETFSRVLALGIDRERVGGGFFPWVLCDDVNFSQKG